MILDYLVVGGGIVGASVSYYMATLVPNAKIMLVDAGTVGGGCTGMSAGTVLCSGEESKTYEARQLYSQLGVYHEIGALQIATDEREVNYLRSLLPAYKVANWLTPNQLRTVEPNLTSVLGAIFTPWSGYVEPIEATLALVEASGVEVCENTTVTEINENENGFYVHVSKDQQPSHLQAKHVVLATGTNKPLDNMQPPIYAVKGQVWVTETAPARTLNHVIFGSSLHARWQRTDASAPSFCTHNTPHEELYPHAYGRPTADGGVMFGGNRIFRSLDPQVCEEALEENRKYVQTFLPKVNDLPLLGSWYGFMPFSYDGEPFIINRGNLWCIGGFGPSGVMKAPWYARQLVEKILFSRSLQARHGKLEKGDKNIIQKQKSIVHPLRPH